MILDEIVVWIFILAIIYAIGRLTGEDFRI